MSSGSVNLHKSIRSDKSNKSNKSNKINGSYNESHRSDRSNSVESYSNESTDSSIISDIDDNGSVPDATSYDRKKEQLKKSNKKEDVEAAEKEYLQKVVLDRITKFLTFDTMIKEIEKEHKNKIKELKDKRTDLEEYIIEFLERIDKDTISCKKDKLTKVVTETKSPIKLESISEALREGFENRKLVQGDEDKLNAIIAEFLERIDKKREIKIKKSIKRSIDKKKEDDKKKDDEKKSGKNNVKENVKKSVKKSV